MLNNKYTLLAAMLLVLIGCSNTTDPVIEKNGFKGYIYYSSNGIYRMQMSDLTSQKLFTEARHPDITKNGQILAVETSPKTRLIYSDLTGANRQTLIESESSTGPIHKYYLNKPRISFDQKYVVYEGDNIRNPNTYVVNATSGELVAKIGDYASKQPMISPSWAPDGSIFVEGWTSMNNGIYKVNSDFTAIERIDPNLSNVSAPNVSPDGTKIAFIRNGELWIMNINGSNPEQIYSGIGNLTMPAWSPDNKYIATVSSGTIYIVELATLIMTKIAKYHYVESGSQLCWRY